MAICALDCGFAVLLCFVLRFIFHLVVFNFCLLVFHSCSFVFDSFSVDRLIYLFIYLSFYFSFLFLVCLFKRMFFCFSLCSLLVLSFCRRVQV